MNFPEKRATYIFRASGFSSSKDNPEDECSILLQNGHCVIIQNIHPFEYFTDLT
jgi:hypothetical protein